MSLLFSMLSRLVIAFLSRSKHLLISWLQSQSAVILEPKKIKYVTLSTFSPSICYEVMELDAIMFVFQMLSFKPAFSLFLYHSHLRGSLVLLRCFRVVSSAYLRLLIFLLAILISTCDSSSLALHMTYSEEKLNRQDDIIQPCCTPFSILNQLFHVMFYWLPLDMDTGFSGNR